MQTFAITDLLYLSVDCLCIVFDLHVFRKVRLLYFGDIQFPTSSVRFKIVLSLWLFSLLPFFIFEIIFWIRATKLARGASQRSFLYKTEVKIYYVPPSRDDQFH